MINPTRRSLLRSSLAIAAAGSLARPYVANAAATDRRRVVDAGLCPGRRRRVQKDRRRLREGERQHDRLQHQSPMRRMRQKIISAMTSGEVPDLFQNNPVEIIALCCLERQAGRRQSTSSRRKRRNIATPRCYRRSATTTSPRSAAFTACRIFGAVPADPYLATRWSRRPATRWRTSRRPGTPFTDFFKAGAGRSCARRACATSMALGLAGDDATASIPNNIFNYFLIAYGGKDIVTKDGKLHLDDPQGQGGGGQGADLSDDRLQGRLCPAERDQLERRRRQQRLSLQADRDGSRRHDLDRGRASSRTRRTTTTSSRWACRSAMTASRSRAS